MTGLYLIDFVKAHWRSVVIVAALLLAFYAGRETARQPDVTASTKVITDARTTTQAVAQQKTQTQEDKVTKTDTVARQANGTVVETKQEVVDVTGVDSQTSASSVTEATIHQVETQTITIRTPDPKWNVTVDLGVPFTLKPPFLGTPRVDLYASHHFFGPVWIGLWGESDIHLHGFGAGAFVSGSFSF